MYYPHKNDPDLQNPNLKLLKTQGYYFLAPEQDSGYLIARDYEVAIRVVSFLFVRDLCWHYTYAHAPAGSGFSTVYKFSFVPEWSQGVAELQEELLGTLGQLPPGALDSALFNLPPSARKIVP